MQSFFSQRFTKKAKKVIEQAQLASKQKNWEKMDGTFLLEALLKNENNLGNLILKKYFHQKKIWPKKNFSSVSAIIKEAFHLAALSKNSYLGTEHLANGIINLWKEKTANPESKKKFFPLNQAKSFEDGENNISENTSSRPEFIPDLNSLINAFFSGRNSEERGNGFLEKFCINLNNQVTNKNNLPLIGRKNELERIIRILSRRNKNNPVLIGEPGVGKTAIVEGLAEKINQYSAGLLNNRKIFVLDLGLLLAGTNFRGEFESRLKEVINQVKKNENIILFIDEIHTLVGAGNAIGGMDAANILKPALSRGEIQIIGATTLDEYRKYIEKDAALERRFQPIFVSEPTQKETIKILKGIKRIYENHHHLKIPDQIIPEIVQLAKQYLPERFLPDSAIDLLDEAAALRHNLSENQEIYQHLNQKKEELRKFSHQKELLVISERYEDAVKARTEEKKIENELKELNKKISLLERKNNDQLLKEDVLQVLSQSSQIPFDLLSQKNQNIPAVIAKDLNENLVGQQEAVEKIYQTLLRQFSGLSNHQRPLGSFLFIGKSGVGKTFTAHLLAKNISPSGKKNLIQINMSELTENHSVSRLLGAPAGYVGYEEGGLLSEKIRRNPYSVVLFDEIEKAGPTAINLLLKILEEGVLTDSKGKNIDFRHSIIILTSNLANEKADGMLPIGFSAEKKTYNKKSFLKIKENILKEIRESFPRELIERLDHLIVFNDLNRQDLIKISQKKLEQLQRKMLAKKYSLKIEPSVYQWIVQKSLHSEHGAHTIQQIILSHIEPILANFILNNPLPQKCQLKTDKKGKLVIKNAMAKHKKLV